MLPLHPHDPPSVGPFRLHARLGEDAYARVYLASAPGEGPVAVRVVRSGYAVDPDFRAAFARLVEDAYGLEARFVCRVRDADTEGAVPWAAVDRPPGPGLADLVRARGPLPAGALHGLALALASGLADLHAAGRVHGSLWPEGVVLSSGSALIADPGLEWAVAELRRRAPHPSFAAPEGGASPAADVFAWAGTVSFAASGVEGAPGLPRIPLQLRGLVEACLRRGPELRPSSADLVRMLGGEGAAGAVPWPPEVLASVHEAAERQRRALDAAGSGAVGAPGGTREVDGAVGGTDGEPRTRASHGAFEVPGGGVVGAGGESGGGDGTGGAPGDETVPWAATGAREEAGDADGTRPLAGTPADGGTDGSGSAAGGAGVSGRVGGPGASAGSGDTAGSGSPAASTTSGAPESPEASGTPGGTDAAGRRRWRGRVLALSAAGLALAVAAGIAVWSYRGPTGEEAAGSEQGTGMITDASCRDGTAYPPPEEEVDGEAVNAWGTAFSPDGDLLAVTASGPGLMVWDWRGREEVARLSESVAPVPGAGPVFAPVGCAVAAVVPSPYEDQEYPVAVATTFDLPSGTTTGHLGPQRGPVDGNWPGTPRGARRVSFSPDGALLGVTLERNADVNADSVGLVDTRTGAQTGSLVPDLAYGTEFAGPGRVVTDDGGTITVWDTGTGEELHTVRGVSHTGFEVVPGTDEVLYPDGDRIVWWDYAERAEVASFRMPGFAEAEEPLFLGVVLAPDRSRVYAGWFHAEGDSADGETRHVNHVWDVETGEDLVAGNEDAVPFRQVSVHPGGEVLAAVTPEDRVVLVDPETLEALGPPLF
ncbi:acyl-ACP thioesterase [Glycomyces fuscus]|nr:acyl-ACP thioesterase [Glycomyces fuscus]